MTSASLAKVHITIGCILKSTLLCSLLLSHVAVVALSLPLLSSSSEIDMFSLSTLIRYWSSLLLIDCEYSEPLLVVRRCLLLPGITSKTLMSFLLLPSLPSKSTLLFLSFLFAWWVLLSAFFFFFFSLFDYGRSSPSTYSCVGYGSPSLFVWHLKLAMSSGPPPSDPFG